MISLSFGYVFLNSFRELDDENALTKNGCKECKFPAFWSSTTLTLKTNKACIKIKKRRAWNFFKFEMKKLLLFCFFYTMTVLREVLVDLMVQTVNSVSHVFFREISEQLYRRICYGAINKNLLNQLVFFSY